LKRTFENYRDILLLRRKVAGRPMRIAFLAADIDLSGRTGDVCHVKDLVCALSRLGCQVDLVIANPADWTPPASVRLIPTPSGNALRAALELRWMLGKKPPDVIYERRESPKLAAVLGRLLGRPYFVEINGLVEEEMAMQGRPDRTPPPLREAKAMVRRRLFAWSAGVVAVTEGLKAALAASYAIPRERIIVVPNGVDLHRFNPLPKDEARRALSLPGDAPIVVFVGTFVAWQGVGTLIAAMERVKAELPHAQLLLVGDGQERPSLEAEAERRGLGKRVRFVGWVARDDVPRWICAADVAVMPSTLRRNARIGSSALKMREYLACGRPVVATNIEGAGPLLEREGIGVGVAGDDPIQLARALIGLLRDSETITAMGIRARTFAQRELSWDLSARRILDFFGGARPAGGG